MSETPCQPSCWAMPDCKRCGMRKAPRGRSVPQEAANGYCSWDCYGYSEEPQSGHLWPGEEPELAFPGHNPNDEAAK